MSTFLSIIVPCYNVEEYLPKTLGSLRNLHDAADCQFIFVDDGSSDKTPFILDHFAEIEARAKVIHKENAGVSTARNTALPFVSGEYVMCLDGDDYLDADAVTIIRNNIKNGIDVLIPSLNIVTNEKLEVLTLPWKEGYYSVNELYKSCKLFSTMPMPIYRSAIIKEHNIDFSVDIHSGEVYDFTVKVLSYSNMVRVIHNAFYNYVMRASSATHAMNYTKDLTVLHLLVHFESINKDWIKTASFSSTTFKLITSFTYNKYIRNNSKEKETKKAIESLLTSKEYINTIRFIVKHPFITSFNIYSEALYLFIFPNWTGYIMILTIYNVLRYIKLVYFKNNL